MKSSGSGTAGADRALRNFMTTKSKLKHDIEIPDIDETVNQLEYESDNSGHAFSDTESISSGSNVGGGGRRSVVVPARFWRETLNLLRRVQPESVSPPLFKSNKPISGHKILDDGPKLSPGRSPFVPVGGAIRLPASPSKRKPNPKPNRNPNPSSTPNGVRANSNLINKPSILNFSANARRGKVGENKLVDARGGWDY
ncbi:hypothetical protein LXL04_025300 [Taraxacum kok-saghyz]